MDDVINANVPCLCNWSSKALYGKIFSATEPSLMPKWENFVSYFNEENAFDIEHSLTYSKNSLNFHDILSATYHIVCRVFAFRYIRICSKEYHKSASHIVNFASQKDKFQSLHSFHRTWTSCCCSNSHLQSSAL